MKMTAILAAISFLFGGCIFKTTIGSGKVTEETRDLKDFKGLSVSTSMRVEVSPGPFKVLVKADDNIQKFVETEVSGGVLYVGYKSAISFQTDHSVVVYVQAPRLDSISLSGASRVIGKLAAQDQLDIDASGGSVVKLGKLEMKKLAIDVTGASSVTLEQFDGAAADIDASGGARIHLKNLHVTTLNTRASGASIMELGGTSDKAEFDVSGGTQVNANSLQVKEVKVEASGVSKLQLLNALAIKGDVSGASRVHAARTAQVNVDHSGVARLIQD